jgi:hypothetical protein
MFSYFHVDAARIADYYQSVLLRETKSTVHVSLPHCSAANRLLALGVTAEQGFGPWPWKKISVTWYELVITILF